MRLRELRNRYRYTPSRARMRIMGRIAARSAATTAARRSGRYGTAFGRVQLPRYRIGYALGRVIPRPRRTRPRRRYGAGANRL